MALERGSPLTDIPGIGPAKAKSLARLGLYRVGDLLGHFPQRYEDRRQCWPIRQAPLDAPCCVSAMVAETPRLSRIRRGLELVKVKAVDHTGTLYITFFNQAYLKDSLKPGVTYVFYGRVEESGRSRAMTNPAFEREGAGKVTGLIMPVYPLTAGVSNNLLAGLTRRAVDECLSGLPDAVPAEVRRAHGLCGAEFAYRNIHYPESFEALEQARRRMIFEELLSLTCGLAMLKGRRSGGAGRRLSADPAEFEKLLPFAPTGAQRRAIADMAADLTSGRAMNRLVQGDVGSGKTAAAAYGAWAAAKNGCQCALMAPTELLAEQHYRTLSALLAPAGVRVGLLTGSVKGAEKKRLLAALAAGDVDVIVGTHALFSDGVAYHDLGLVIADEQHRFGVAQRAALAAKGATSEMGRGSGEGRGNSLSTAADKIGSGVPAAACRGGDAAPGTENFVSTAHVLVMSATPIPRTLALIIYGDLDVSIIDELPPGRTPVATYVVGEDKRQRMYNFVRAQAALGRQIYIVCPAVDEGEPLDDTDGGPAMDLKAVTTYARELQEQVFPDLRVGFVHGKLRPKDKEAVMAAFAAGELDVLVSTTVIEVGVDVPNAALMVVENAERFGLSQLHQLRGRVGRGAFQSYCVLVSDNQNEETRRRLKVMTSTTDGFRIAEEDLRLRGPGDFFGQRQSGLPGLKAADLGCDTRLLQEAQTAAETLLAEDPELKTCPAAAERVRLLFDQAADTLN